MAGWYVTFVYRNLLHKWLSKLEAFSEFWNNFVFKFGILEKNVKAYVVSKGNAVIRSSGYLLTKEQSWQDVTEK